MTRSKLQLGQVRYLTTTAGQGTISFIPRPPRTTSYRPGQLEYAQLFYSNVSLTVSVEGKNAFSVQSTSTVTDLVQLQHQELRFTVAARTTGITKVFIASLVADGTSVNVKLDRTTSTRSRRWVITGC